MKYLLNWFSNMILKAFAVPEVTNEDVADQLLDSVKFNREKNIEENILIGDEVDLPINGGKDGYLKAKMVIPHKVWQGRELKLHGEGYHPKCPACRAGEFLIEEKADPYLCCKKEDYKEASRIKKKEENNEGN